MSLNLPHITDFTITPKGNFSLKKYLTSVIRSLPENWEYLKDEEYSDNDTFHILNDVYCIEVIYKFEENGPPLKAKIFIGLKEDRALLLNINFRIIHDLKDKMNHINFMLYWFHYFILKRNKYYDKFEHKFELGGPLDENWNKTDIRDSRTVKIRSKKENRTIFMSKGLKAKLGNQEIYYFLPNNIAISLSIAKKAYKRAIKLYAKLKKNNDKIIKLHEADKPELYDYFEEIITSLTFAYISVEALTNAAIPENFTKEKKNQRGIKEVWTKNNIERWMTTTEKITQILPEVFKSGKIEQEKFWNKFIELERLRNEVVHQKTINQDAQMDEHVYSLILNSGVFEKIKSALYVIEFFYKQDNSHIYFPLGMGIARMKFKEVDSLDDFLSDIITIN